MTTIVEVDDEAKLERELTARLRDQATRLLVERADAEESGGVALSQARRRDLGEQVLSEELERLLTERLNAGLAMPSVAVEERMVRTARNALFGLGALQALLEDREVENIYVNGFDRVFVSYADGRKERVAPFASSDQELVDLVRTLAARSGEEERRFDRSVPGLSLQLVDGSRLFAVMAVTPRVSLSIRRHRFTVVSLPDLRGLGTIDRVVEDFLRAMVRAKKNAVILGGPDGGKTTLLRALVSEIPALERIIVIEDTAELMIENDGVHEDVVPLQARQRNLEGEGALDQAELVRWALRMGPQRVIVGEIRGPEVIAMCNAMSLGLAGSLSTLHCSSTEDADTKFANYAIQAPERLSREATCLMLASAVDFLVQLSRDERGSRVVSSIREVVGADGPRLVTNEVFAPEPATGRAVPRTPLRATTAAELARHGYTAPLPADLEDWV
ncbi:pilus assembly protein CpaF [Streptacidiphilus sp. MAP12-16]|uniref:CpaF family protein n=1 Tax=Streptacidiphilus sp. MAP12-16 TaxID=3156300 RepID=UPI003518DA16